MVTAVLVLDNMSGIGALDDLGVAVTGGFVLSEIGRLFGNISGWLKGIALVPGAPCGVFP